MSEQDVLIVQADSADSSLGWATLGDRRWRSRALIGMLLCISGVIGLWGIGFFSPELINDVIGRSLKAEGIALAKQPGFRTMWVGVNMIVQNAGSFAGMLVFTKLASRHGRRPVFAVGYICAMLSTIMVFKFLNQRSDIFWMVPLMGLYPLAGGKTSLVVR